MSMDEERLSLASSGEGLHNNVEENEGLIRSHEGFQTNEDDNDDNVGGNSVDFLRGRFKPTRRQSRRRRKHRSQDDSSRPMAHQPYYWDNFFYRTLLPDTGLSIRGFSVIEASGVATKLLKFILLTFVSIAVMHVVVAHLFDDRDKMLQVKSIWRYEFDLIVRDCFVFFVVGRLWEKPGIDHLAWMGTAILSNVYFESQNFLWFLQHSVTLFEMHCLWPWELWIFALVLVVAATGLVIAHAVEAWNERFIISKLIEVGLCVLFFMAPMVTSDYFHLHHWYAGWLMGMQFNYNMWWSQLAMAWCWGMYINGIAVYGRDPVLTCEYAYFLTLDNRCPYISCYLEGLKDVNNTKIKEMVPVDWRNCSATDDFHP